MKAPLFAVLLLASLSVLALSLSRNAELLSGKYDLTVDQQTTLFEEYIDQYYPELLKNFQLSEISIEERKSIFLANLQKVIVHNKNPSKSYSKGINKFSGLTEVEKSSYILRDPQNCSATARASLKSQSSLRKSYAAVPETQDWRTQGVVTEVKNQGGCGSCWTFSTTGCLEAHWALKTKQTPPLLSEQQLVDCAGDFNNFGCNGGLPAQAFEYIRYSGGLDSEAAYPYEGQDGTCRFKPSAVAASVPGGSVNITAYDEQEILQSVGLVGPVSIAFEVTNEFEAYSSGVFVDSTCNQDPEHVNHAVLIVGYGTENGQDYWIVKNSWGPSWGEDGYFRIVRGANACGLATCASYPNVFG